MVRVNEPGILNQLWARVKQGDTLAINIALLAIVFLQMPIRFSTYITYDCDFHKVWHPNGTTSLVQ